ncbi:Hypothetical protein A7982_11897 [Minicystis rosea]|nr:Hypothetical protein A7982_11897 [Minicystis rosea]
MLHPWPRAPSAILAHRGRNGEQHRRINRNIDGSPYLDA